MITTTIVCHTSVTKYSELFNKEIFFKEGGIFNAQCFGPNYVDIYDETDSYYVSLTGKEFYDNFMTIVCAKNEEKFFKLLNPTGNTLKNKFNNLLILKQWQQKKQLKQI